MTTSQEECFSGSNSSNSSNQKAIIPIFIWLFFEVISTHVTPLIYPHPLHTHTKRVLYLNMQYFYYVISYQTGLSTTFNMSYKNVHGFYLKVKCNSNFQVYARKQHNLLVCLKKKIILNLICQTNKAMFAVYVLSYVHKKRILSIEFPATCNSFWSVTWALLVETKHANV